MEPKDEESGIHLNDPPGDRPRHQMQEQEQAVGDLQVQTRQSNETEDQTAHVSPSSNNEDHQTSATKNPNKEGTKTKSKSKRKRHEQKHTYHGLCDVIFHYLSNTESARVFLHSTLPTNIKVVKQNEYEEGEKSFAGCNQSFASTLDLPKGSVVQEVETSLFRAWFRYKKDPEELAWMEVVPAERRAYTISNKQVSASSIESTLAGGAMTSPTVFVKHWSVPVVNVTFEHDNELLSISKKLDYGPEEIMEIPYSTLSDTVVAHYDNDAWHLYIGLKNPPKLLEKSETKKRNSIITEEKRLVRLTSVTREDIGYTSVLCLDVPDIKKTNSSQTDAWMVVARLKRHGFSISYANVSVRAPKENLVNKIEFGTFDLCYTWECLLSCGFKVTDSITSKSLQLLEDRKCALTPEVFQDMTNIADNSHFFEFENVLTTSMNKFDHTIAREKRDELPSHFSMTRRMVVTPTRIIPQPKEPIVQNRIIRQYNDDFFIRVMFRDEDFARLSAARAEGLKNITERLRKFMDAGFKIGDRKYEFLACSNSQLREHGVWFFCPNNDMTAESIRFAAGDLSKETCIATYVSRMGLCFSASRATVEVDVADGSVDYIDDVESESYCFTDGIGKISVPLAKKVAGTLMMDPVPSAFQIRYGGCKGVVSQDPTLGNGELIHIRNSMCKFESSSKVLEILQTTHPGQLYLNRQVITLMSGLGVPDKVFLTLQEKMLFNMADMLLDNNRALRSLSEVNIGMKYRDLMKAGISFTGEAFFRSVLMTIYKRKRGELIRKTRIEVDYDQGRSMMGTIDETGILEYGQVFISYTEHDGINYKSTKILEAEVVVAKNPCFHPGDLRKFQAVDVPGLHHLVDCIVFPQRGPRPHPDEMSGSDLDGDMYFVCWDKMMHPPGENKAAMDFQSAPKTKLWRNVQVSDVTGFISEYIRNDQLGVIANAHVVHADLKDIYCSECLTLSKKHSDAVDFPKTGVVPEMTADLRSEKYPDFMMKSDKPRYTSKKILGKLYRQSRSLEQAHNRTYNIDLLQDASVVDEDMVYPGYEKYLESAHISYDLYNEKILQLMSLYGIETEAEVVTGVIQKLHKKRGFLQNEKYEIEKILKGKMTVIRQKVRADFFEEFGEEKIVISESADTKNFLAKASAWYVVAYDVTLQGDRTGQRLVSFPWIMSDFLSQIKANACPVTRGDTTDRSDQPERPELVQIGLSVVRHFDTRHENRFISFEILRETFNIISDHFHRWLGPGIRVSCTGLSPLCLMDMYTREINVCLELQKRIPEKEFNNLLRHIMAGYQQLTPRTFIVQIRQDPVTVTFSQNSIDVGRTDFIRRQLQSTPSYTLILTFLLDWGRKNEIIGRSRAALFSEVIFTLLVLKLLSDADSNSTEMKATRDDKNGTDVSSWLPGKTTPNKQFHIATLLMAVLRNFESLLITDEKGEIRIHVQDPTCDANSRLVYDNLGWRKCKHLTEEILFAYHEIAKNRSVNVFFEQNIIEESHLMMNLPLEIWGSVMFAEDYIARRLSEETGAEVSIRRTKFRDTSGLILEAWGTHEELWNVQQSLQDLNDKSSKFITTLARDKIFIDGAFKRVFYGSTSPDQQLAFNRYIGRCQPKHKQLTLYVPYVNSSSGNDITALEKFKEIFRTQIELIRQDFNSTYHGDLRIALTFGICYIFYVENPQFTISEFEMAFEGNVNPQEKQVQHNPPLRGGWRNRKRHGRFTKPKPRHMRASFMPKECDKSNVSAFLETSFFKERNEEVKYHATFKLFANQNYGKPHEGLVVLDKDLVFIELRLSDLKWMAVDVCRGYTDIHTTNKRLDVRCKLHSRRLMNMEGVQEMADTKTLLEPSTRVLLKPQPNVLDVSSEFRDRVSFVREKHAKSYTYEGPVTENNIWQDMKIDIATVFEYSIPDSSGRFQDMVEKQEVTVIPKLPSFDTTETDWDSYAENIWELIEQLGEQFDSD